MSNMSYCRFENTYRDLADCQFALETMATGDGTKLNEDEERYAAMLITTCRQILEDVLEFADVGAIENIDDSEAEKIVNNLQRRVRE